jgi:selenide,water dikinase
MTDITARRLTSYAHGGGCACKISPGELEQLVAGLLVTPPASAGTRLLVGLDDGDDAAVTELTGVTANGTGLAVVSTADFLTPVVDDAYDWGRIAAANALSDVYAMAAGRSSASPAVLAADTLPLDLAAEVLAVAWTLPRLRSRWSTARTTRAQYGLAVTGWPTCPVAGNGGNRACRRR